MQVIVPAAGLSSRFPNMKPKYLLEDFENKLMLEKAIKPYLDAGLSITIGVLKEHNEKYNSKQVIKEKLGDKVNVVIIPELTKGPADTAYQILQNIGEDEFIIKDCDSYFTHTLTEGNYICVSDIADYPNLNRPEAKSYIITDADGNVNNIVEKKVVSNKFCLGGYKFQSVKEYKEAFESISQEREVFVSDVIAVMLQSGHTFKEKLSLNYVDVGTSQEWFNYNNLKI